MLTLSLILLVPYFVWGVVSLHRRFLLHEEWPLGIELATLIGLIGFYAVALPTLRPYLAANPSLLVFSGLGLFISTFALYGHIMISVAARFLVDVVMTPDNATDTSPRLGPAESLERVGDFAGAYAEYLVLARMYPNLTDLKVRLAGACVKLGRDAEAADWLDHALLRMRNPENHAIAAVQLAEIAEAKLGDTARARAALQGFIDRHPAHEDARHLAERMERIGKERADAAPRVGLDAMHDHPMQEELAPTMPDLPETTRLPQRTPRKEPLKSTLVPLDDAPFAPDPEPEASPRPRSGASTLQSLEELPEPEAVLDPEPEVQARPSFGQDRMLDADEDKQD